MPILLSMDAFAVRAWWRRWDAANLRTIIPGGILGTFVGLVTFQMLSADAMRVRIGGMAPTIAIAWFVGPTRTVAKRASTG